MPQEPDVRIERELGPLLHVAKVHIGVHGARSPGVRAKVGVDKGEIQMNSDESRTKVVRRSYEFRTNSYEIRAKFVQICYEFIQIHFYG